MLMPQPVVVFIEGTRRSLAPLADGPQKNSVAPPDSLASPKQNKPIGIASTLEDLCMILREVRRRLLLLSIAARSEQQQPQHHPLLPPRAMSAVAEAPPAAKKPKTAYGEHTRDVSLRDFDRDCALHWAGSRMEEIDKKKH
jgi:hypothetical protein